MDIKDYLDGIKHARLEENDNLKEWVSTARDGMILEFGVFTGTSLRQIAHSTSRPVFGFDSFEGLPAAASGGWTPGQFATEIPTFTERNVKLVVGLIQDTLEPFLASHPGPVAFAHIDVDIYFSSLFILNMLYDSGRMVPGTILLFDELMDYTHYEEHEYRALIEFARRTGIVIEVLGRRHKTAYAFKVKWLTAKSK
jgi:hypothetical protein